jgi:ankyrin repeat protein
MIYLLVIQCGATALQEAALAGHVEIVEMLLKAGADVNAQYHRKSARLPYHNIETPVYLASHRGWLAVVDTLVQAGAKVDIANRVRPKRDFR